jgi:calcineurin-like phosphoesterase family protein
MIEQLYKPFQHWSADGTVWVYSDPHFNDSEMSAYGRISDEEQLARINSKVGKKDTIIILGDVGDISFIRRIKGRKILIMGNHDKGRSNYERQIIKKRFDKGKYSKEEVLDIMKAEYPDYTLSIFEGYDCCHEPFVFWGVFADNKLFDEVYEGILAIGEKIILSHEPFYFPFAVNLHGHVHKGDTTKNCINCCSNVINYTPISLNKLIKDGAFSKVETIHRLTIDDATERKQKRLKKANSRK